MSDGVGPIPKEEIAADIAQLRAFLPPDIAKMPDEVLIPAYERFSEIQCASWLLVSKKTAAQFEFWWRAADDLAAWA